MSRAFRRYLIGSVAMLALAGCGRGFVSFEDRPAWRGEAEATCLKSGAVKVGTAVAQMDPISGPGMCGANFPLKVAALVPPGDSNRGLLGYAETVRPPGTIPNGAQPRWPIAQPQYAPPSPQPAYPQPSGRYAPQVLQAPGGGSAAISSSGEPMMISPGVNGQPAYGAVPPPSRQPSYAPANGPYAQPPAAQPAYLPPRTAPVSVEPEIDEDDDVPDDAVRPNQRSAPATRPASSNPPAARVPPIPQLGPPRGLYTGASTPVTVSPPATLACPIVSALDRWVANTVQPAARRWFNQPVVEIKQISAYSCRGMNGQPGARISEHAFGNALDIAAFVLADGRRIVIKRNWTRGTPEEQGFLHDVQGGACDTFTTVLAPGSNKYHYDHIHVDLMRRASRRLICQPRAIDGQVAAARAASRLAGRADPTTTGSIGTVAAKSDAKAKYAIPGEDDIFDDDEIDDAPTPRPSAVAKQSFDRDPAKQY